MRRIVIVAFPGVQPLDVAGPAEVFTIATRFAAGSYSVEVRAPQASPLATGSGYCIAPAGDLATCRGAIDTLVVAGGNGTRDAARDDDLIDWLRAGAGRARRVTSVCTGAFLLARAGLLDGRRATTHWAWADDLARQFPRVEVDAEPIFVVDGPIRTSAGVTAGIDLALAMVEEDLGPGVALDVARQLVMFVRRPGGQAQFSAQLAARAAERAPLPIEAVATRCGFGTPETMRRAFARRLGVSPNAYRSRFAA